MNATKSICLKESQQLVSITDDLVKLDVKNCVQFPNSAGVFDGLLFSKSGNMETREVSSAASKTFKTSANSCSQRRLKMKQRKPSLAHTIMQHRKSMLPDSCSTGLDSKTFKDVVNRRFDIPCTMTPVTTYSDETDKMDKMSYPVNKRSNKNSRKPSITAHPNSPG